MCHTTFIPIQCCCETILIRHLCSCLKVKVSLDSLMEALLELSDIGDSVGRVVQLLKELKSLQDSAQV